MGLVDTAKSLIVRPKPRLDVARYRSAKPVRNPAVRWEGSNEGALLLLLPVDERDEGRLTRWLRRHTAGPAERKFELEEVGAFVWNACDGTKTVAELAKGLQQHYKMNRLEAEASLAAFLETLTQRGLVSLYVKERR